jgi:hypothetical protein
VGWDKLCRAISQTGGGLDAEVLVVDRRKRSRVGFLQCNAVRSVHEDGWQREAARAVLSDVTGRPWVR